MNDQFDELSLNEAAINDVETARLALRWALDKIRALQEEMLRIKQNLQEKTAQTSFMESQLKSKNAELEKIVQSHDEEMNSRQDSLEYRFRSKLERLTEREKELEDKISRQDELLKQKENKLMDDYQKKSDELRERWAQVEAELWKLRQEQLTKQQEFEKLYSARLDDERKKSAAEIESVRASLDKAHADRLSDLEKRESSVIEELKKQEAVLKWAKDSFQAEASEREKALKQKDLDIDKKLMEKNQEIEDYKVQTALLQKQLSDLPEVARKRGEDLDRYKQAMESLEGVIRALEAEKKSFQADSGHKIAGLNESLEAERTRYREMEADIPRRLKIAIEHERARLAEKLSEVENNYKEDLRKRAEEAGFLERNLKTFEENSRTLQAERDSLSRKVESLQTQYNIKLEEFSFRERQLESEYDVRLKVEMEKKTAALKNEIDSSYRIYEDNLRLKVEEIAHLRRELEGAVNDKMAFQTQAAESRRAVDAVKDKAETELAALRVQLKGECERQLAGELAEAGLRQAAEKKRLVEDFEGQLNDVRLEVSRKDHETARLREAQRKLEEAVQREADRVAELVSRKNQELDSLRLAKEAQEDAYRKSLEDFRSKLSEAVGKLETYEAGRVLKKPE